MEVSGNRQRKGHAMTAVIESEETDLEWEENEENSLADQFLTFALAGEEYGVPVAHVTEIISVQDVTKVPNMPVYVRGVINLRGKVIPVMDVRLRFSMEERAYDERTCFIVVDVDGAAFGLAVDTVREVVDIPPEAINPPPKMSHGSGLIKGLGKQKERVTILLDTQELLVNSDVMGCV